MGCEYLDDYYELYVLGVATDAVGQEIREHVRTGCAYCVQHLREASLSTYLLSLATKPVRPDAKVKSQVLKQARRK